MATPTSDPFIGRQPDLGSPTYSGAFAITPGTALPVPTRALNVAASGAVSVTDMFGVTTVLTISAGVAFPMRCAAVNSSGTTATGIVGLI